MTPRTPPAAALLRDARLADRRRLGRPPRPGHRPARAPSSRRPAAIEVYACGPPAMLEAVRAAVRRPGRPRPARARVRRWPAATAPASAAWSPTRDGYHAPLRRRPGVRRGERSRRARSPGRALTRRLLRPRARPPGHQRRRAPSTRSPRGACSATRCSTRLPVRGLRLQDGHARPAPGQPAAAAVGAAGRADQLDRPAEQGARPATSTHDLPELARAAGAADRQRDGLQRASEVARAGRGVRRARRRWRRSSSTSPARTSRPGSIMGADPGELARLLRARPPADAKPLIVKLTPNASDVAGRRRGGRGGGRRRGLADQHAPRRWRSHPPHGRSRGSAGGTGGVSGPAVRAVALAQVAAVAAARRASRSSAWAASQRGRARRDLLDAGATLVAVGTESFRDPAAGVPDRRRSFGEISRKSAGASQAGRRRSMRYTAIRKRLQSYES